MDTEMQYASVLVHHRAGFDEVI